MWFIAVTIFLSATRLVALAIGKPVPNWKVDGMAIPLSNHRSFLDSGKGIDLDAITSHAIAVREKILTGLDNYEMNTGMVHPFSVKRSDSVNSGLGMRDASVPLIMSQYSIWMGEISIGTPSKVLKVQIDTGAADMWVLEVGCEGISRDRDLWDPRLSSSAKDQERPFEFRYSDGSLVEGGVYSDNITIAGFTTFGSATLYTSHIENNGYADGLLGLAFPSASRLGTDPLAESLSRQNRLSSLTFSLKLSPSGAEMYVGGTNSMPYDGNIVYTPITVPALWQVSMDDIRANDFIILRDVPVIFDTGSAFIFGDRERVAELYRHLGATLLEYRGFGYYHMPCDSFPTLSFTFGGKTFAIPPEVLSVRPFEEGSTNCVSAIISQSPAPNTGYWSIGLTFLQGVYSVFDYNHLRVGFAELA